MIFRAFRHRRRAIVNRACCLDRKASIHNNIEYNMITIKHNFDESKFKWLWAKYVNAGNIEKHCTACLKGPYSYPSSG